MPVLPLPLCAFYVCVAIATVDVIDDDAFMILTNLTMIMIISTIRVMYIFDKWHQGSS